MGRSGSKAGRNPEAKRNLGRTTHCCPSWSHHLHLWAPQRKLQVYRLPYLWALLSPQSLHRERASSWLSVELRPRHMGTWPPSLPVWEAEHSLPPSSQVGKVFGCWTDICCPPCDLITSYGFHESPEKIAAQGLYPHLTAEKAEAQRKQLTCPTDVRGEMSSFCYSGWLVPGLICEILTRNVSRLSNDVLEGDPLSHSLDTALHKPTDLHVICLILLLLLLILFAPRENTGHTELICSAIQCVKWIPRRED